MTTNNGNLHQRIEEKHAGSGGRRSKSKSRSDWHEGFEALLRIDMYEYGDAVKIFTEHEIGSGPPRVDFLELVETERVSFKKEIFRIFRRFNIIEYKNPYDSLNERVLRKVAGYANMYIGNAEHEGDVTPEQVTISVFRERKNKQLFKKLQAAGMLHSAEASGIYRVTGITDLPFQIVITEELEGDEYAAYRALTSRAKETDMRMLIENAREASSEIVRDHYNSVINLVLGKNPEYAGNVRRVFQMEDVLMDIMKDRVEERIIEAVNNNTREMELHAIKNLMESTQWSVDKAMDSLKISPEQRSTYAELVRQSLQ